MRFVDEDLGDPFFKYLLLLAPNQTLSLTDDRKVSFELFVPHEGPNTEQRAFFFESAAATGGATLAPPVNPGPRSSFRRDQQCQETAPKQRRPGLDRQSHRNHPHCNHRHARRGGPSKSTQAAWEALSAHERGDIVHFVRDFAGREEPVAAETYESLEEERRGRREFYRRELPRLAEVEVWGLGETTSASALVEGGGTLNLTSAGKTPAPAFDGDISSRYQQPTRDPPRPRCQRADHRHRPVRCGWTKFRVTGSNIRGYQMRSSTGERGRPRQAALAHHRPAGASNQRRSRILRLPQRCAEPRAQGALPRPVDLGQFHRPTQRIAQTASGLNSTNSCCLPKVCPRKSR